MKTITLFFFIAFFSIVHAKPNDSTKINNKLGKNELYVSYGILSLSGLGIGLGRTSLNKDFPTDYFYNKTNYNVSTKQIPPLIGAFNFGYKRYFVKNKIAVLFDVTLGQINTTYKNKNTDSLSFKTKDNLIAIMPGFEYHYFNKKIVQLYSGFQLGFFIYNQKYTNYQNNTKKHNEINFAFQIDAFGVRVGKKIAGFLELGFGFGGIVKVGISGRF